MVDAAAKKKRSLLSLEDKAKIFDLLGKGVPRKSIAEEFGIHPTAITKLKKRGIEHLNVGELVNDSTLKKRKYIRRGKYDDLEKALVMWISEKNAANIPITDELLKNKAIQFAKDMGISETEFKASNGWLHRFKGRHGFMSKSFCGEIASADFSGAAIALPKLQEIIGAFKTCDVFNVDETGIVYKELPKKTIWKKNVRCAGKKSPKERITVLFCVSAEGQKRKPLVIGASSKPRCFKNINLKGLPVTYAA